MKFAEFTLDGQRARTFFNTAYDAGVDIEGLGKADTLRDFSVPVELQDPDESIENVVLISLDALKEYGTKCRSVHRAYKRTFRQ